MKGCANDYLEYIDWLENVTTDCAINDWSRACTPMGKYDLIQVIFALKVLI